MRATMQRIGIVCGSYHREAVEQMLAFAREEAKILGYSVDWVHWVSGSMEVPLALARMMSEVDGAACLGIIEKGETQHGLAMGQAVIKSILELQLQHNKPIGLGIIGPGAEPHHIEPRLEPHARSAIQALADF